MITLTLPWPPSVNSLYPSNKSGRRFLSKKGKEYLMAVELELGWRGANDALTGRLAYRLSLYPPDKRIRDLSNHQKAIEDCLTKCHLWLDDSQIDHLEVDRMPITKGGRATIEIWDLGCEVRPA